MFKIIFLKELSGFNFVRLFLNANWSKHVILKKYAI